MIMLAVGAIAVFRRGRHTWASLIVLGLGGLLSLCFGFQSMFLALIVGGAIALAATRSVTTIGWAILLALVSLGNRPLDAADDRLVRYFAGPHAGV